MARLLPRWWLPLVATISAAVALVAVVGTATADATTYTYAVPAVERVDAQPPSVAHAAQPQVSYAREGSTSPSVGAWGTSTTPYARSIATEAEFQERPMGGCSEPLKPAGTRRSDISGE